MGPESRSHNYDFISNDCDVNGLTTTEALTRLQTGIKAEWNKYNVKKSRWEWICSAVGQKSENSLLYWISSILLLLCALALIVVSFTDDEQFRYEHLGVYGFILLILLAFNLAVVLWDFYLCHIEISNKIKDLLTYLSEVNTKCNWQPDNYPHLCSPYSPCITLQWTYRDGSLVNLPWSLLVEGDLVSIRPGQPAPGHCIPISGDSPELHFGQVYSPMPVEGTTNSSSSKLSARPPLTNKLYKLCETPFLRNLQLLLSDKHSVCRPVTFHNRSRHILMNNCVEQLALPLFLCFIISINVLRYIYLKHWVGSGTWLDMFVVVPVCTVLPLLPLVFPTMWVFLTCVGNAIIAANLIEHKNNLSEMKQKKSDSFDDTDLGEKGSITVDIKSKLPWSTYWGLFLDAFMGRQKHGIIRSANLLHVLASVTALCCVDKKGILSWPNPTAEKIFFLRKPDTPSCNSHVPQSDVDPATQSRTATDVRDMNESSKTVTDVNSASAENNDNHENELKPNNNSKHSVPQSHESNSAGHMQVEVLDLTHDHSCPFRLEFDDAAWKRHLSSLKPLGLAILLNTCNMDTQGHYMQFCSHVTCEALYNEDLIPIINRRCLCEVAKQIGFTETATQLFSLESQLSTFRHVQPESVRHDMRLARVFPPSTKLKFPFPHMVAVIMKEETKQGGLQLFSQGTADIILDCCIEYWDGNKLCKLSAAERRKIQDFYQRTSLSAYCTAFSYRPLFRGAAQWLSDVYMELPTDGLQHHAPSPLPGAFSQFHSTDSLIAGEVQEPDVTDIEGCYKLQSNQVFIGMITMQYQAQSDIVELIEQLDGACIRFVHFSKENEFRSRVFSEKVGLESGWNCHISLLSDANLLASQSLEPDDDIVEPCTADIDEFGYDVASASDGVLQPLLMKDESTITKCSNNMVSTSRHNKSHTNQSCSVSTPCLTSRLAEHMPLLSMAKVCTHVEQTNNVRNVAEDSGADEDSVILQQQQIGVGVPGDWQSQSLSCLTDSTEQSVPVNFDMSNRAKLPRGIENIRPHLEQVDNVPLLVSLFTDCTSTTTREMIKIMQDYGEVVCVIGSSANADNVGIFLQANASIAVEPLHPQVCQQVPVCKPVNSEEEAPSPISVSKLLNSIPCSISIYREESLSIFQLVQKARHYMKQLWNCTQYWVCCVISVSCAQLLASLLMLPPLFSAGQVLWLSLVVIPFMSVSLVSSSPDPEVMKRATDKKTSSINTEVALFVLWCYGTKFLSTIAIVPVVFFTILESFCDVIGERAVKVGLPPLSSSDIEPKRVIEDEGVDDGTKENWHCKLVYPFKGESGNQTNDTWGGWTEFSFALLSVQHLMVFIMTLHFITISVSFVHRDYLCWRRSPHRNVLWLIVLLIVFLIQVLYTTIGTVSAVMSVSSVGYTAAQNSTITNVPPSELLLTLWQSVPLSVIVVILASPVIVFIVNEFIKWQEIKANVRYQKRARLEFGTKLGMNSPF